MIKFSKVVIDRAKYQIRIRIFEKIAVLQFASIPVESRMNFIAQCRDEYCDCKPSHACKIGAGLAIS